MPKYVALTLLLFREQEKYIQPGEVFEIDNQETEAILLEAGCIKAATVPPEHPDIPAGTPGTVNKSKSKAESGGSS